MPPSPYEGSSGIKFRTAHSSAYVREQFRVATSADTRRFDDFCARTFKQTWGFGSPEPFRRAEKPAEWAFMNDQDPDNRIEASRDEAPTRLSPAHGRLLRRGGGACHTDDAPAVTSPSPHPISLWAFAV